MKVTMLGTLPPLKGIAYYCWHLSEALSKKIDIEFFSFNRLYPNFLYPGGTVESDGVDLMQGNERLKIHRSLDILNPWTWVRTSFCISGDAVHVQFWSLPIVPIWITILLLLRRKNKKILITVHNTTLHEPTILDHFLVRLLLKFGDGFIVHYELGIEDLHNRFHIPREKIIYLPMGTHGLLYKKSKKNISRSVARKALDLEDDAKVILLFGNIRKYKGVDDFIDAIAKVKKQFRRKVIGLIAGQVWGKFNAYQKIIAKQGLENDIKTWLRYIPMAEVGLFFEASDVVVLPYKSMGGQSGVGNIALEYYKPLVVTKVGGLADLLLNKKFAVDPGRPDQLAQKILEIIQNDRVAKQLAEDAKLLLQNNSWDKITDKTIETYRNLIGN